MENELKNLLSADAGVKPYHGAETPRWSLYAQPEPKYVVTPRTEGDVCAIVRYCNGTSTPFLVSNGGNGFSSTFDLGSNGLVIDISKLDRIDIKDDIVTIQAGVRVKQLNEALYAASPKRRIASPTCNTLGWLGAALGGGIPRTIGHDGLCCDRIVSARVVLASGEVVTASKDEHPDLFWGIRGAGPDLGVVLSADLLTAPGEYPDPKAGIGAVVSQWQGTLVYPESKLKALFDAADSIELLPHLQEDITIVAIGTLDSINISTTSVRHIWENDGDISQADAEAAFKPILDVGPSEVKWELLPYHHWNDISDPTCAMGGMHGLLYTVGTSNLDGATFERAYGELKKFIKENEGEVGAVFFQAQCYHTEEVVKMGEAGVDGGGAYPWRRVGVHVVWGIFLTEENVGLVPLARAVGEKVRAILSASVGDTKSSYVNFAHGDEDLGTIYGSSLGRLKAVKAKYDPANTFNQWFPIGPRS